MATRSLNNRPILDSRVRVVVIAGSALALVFTGGCVWPQFGYGPDHTSFNPLERTIGMGNVGGLHEVPGALSAGETSSPSVENGTVYVGSPDGKLYTFPTHLGRPTARARR